MNYFEKKSFLIIVEIYFLIIDLMKKYGKYHSFFNRVLRSHDIFLGTFYLFLTIKTDF